MQQHQVGALRYYTFDLFDRYGLTHGVFTRHGGISPQPWHSLNLGGTNGDDRNHVIENRRRIFEVMGRPVDSIFDSWQVHGTEVICTETPRPLDSLHQKADGILTNRPEITLFMRFADCVPILLFDPVHHVAGIVHAGWRGTVAGAAAAAVDKMKTYYGSNPRDLLAGIGPSICVDHYEVGRDPDVVANIRQTFNSHSDAVLKTVDGRVHFNLQMANQLVLEQSGVQQIEQAGLCTACHPEDWFSHRAEKGLTGRFGALLAL